MAVTQYVGARYVPLFADPAEWSATRTYEPLTVVLYQGNSYTSRQAVPVGAQLTDTRYWLQTGNWDAQVEQYRQEVFTFDARIRALEAKLANISTVIQQGYTYGTIKNNGFLYEEGDKNGND